MEVKDMEARLRELKIQQAEVFKKKKASNDGDRDDAALDAIRQEMNDLKEQVNQALSERRAQNKKQKR